MALSKMPEKGGLVTGNRKMIESEQPGYDCLGFRDGGPMGSCEWLNQTTLFSSSHRHTCSAHTHTPIWAPERNQATKQQEQSADFIHKLRFPSILSYSLLLVMLFRSSLVKVSSTVEIYINIRPSVVSLRQISAVLGCIQVKRSPRVAVGFLFFGDIALFLSDCKCILSPFTLTFKALHQRCRHPWKRLS